MTDLITKERDLLRRAIVRYGDLSRMGFVEPSELQQAIDDAFLNTDDLPAKQDHFSKYVPGVWRCAKCEFRLIQSNLNSADGTVTARDTPGELCPNCDTPLWRVTWKDEATEAYAIAENQLERALAAERRISELQKQLGDLLDIRQQRAVVLHDKIWDAREIIRARLKPDSPKEDRDLFDNLHAAKYILGGDPFDMDARALFDLPPPSALKQEWPHLVQIGRTLAFFASAIKSGESWSETCQRDYDLANQAMKDAWADLKDRPLVGAWRPQPWHGPQILEQKRDCTHDEAVQMIVDVAGYSILSYEEAVLGYCRAVGYIRDDAKRMCDPLKETGQ